MYNEKLRDHFCSEDCLRDISSFRRSVREHMKADSVVLDLGTGAGYAALAAAPLVKRVVATDPCPEMLHVAKNTCESVGLGNVAFEVCSAESIPAPDGEYDGVLMRYTLHHCELPLRALSEVRRVLAPAGHLLLCEACLPQQVVRLWSVIELLRHGEWRPYFTYQQQMEMLRKAGFTVLQARPQLAVQRLESLISSAPEDLQWAVETLVGALESDERQLMHFCSDECGTTFAYDSVELVAVKST